MHPELIVDKTRGEKMEIHMNISFPRVPCELLTLDVMDVSGEVQTGVMHGVNKVRLRPESEGGGEISRGVLDLAYGLSATSYDVSLLDHLPIVCLPLPSHFMGFDCMLTSLDGG